MITLEKEEYSKTSENMNELKKTSSVSFERGAKGKVKWSITITTDNFDELFWSMVRNNLDKCEEMRKLFEIKEIIKNNKKEELEDE